MGLKRYDVLVRQNSDKSTDYVITIFKKLMNKFQDSDDNKNEDGSYKYIWYSSVFDSRNNKSYKIFCDYATNKYNIENEYICENGEKVTGVIYLSKVVDEIEILKTEIAFLKAQIYNNDVSNNNKDIKVKILT